MHETDPERLVDDEQQPLSEHVRAAAAPPVRLHPYAVDRIERRLLALGPDASLSVWRTLRVPAYALASALVAALAWEHTASQAVVAKNPRVAEVVSNPPSLPMPLRLTTGSLELRTDTDPAVVETPNARVEIEAHSKVRITVITGQRDVRIAAMEGAARVVYFDGVTELAPTAAPAPKHRAHTKRVAQEVVEEAAVPPIVDEETASLQAALARLRSAPDEALTLIDAHLLRYGDGVTRERAERSRIALLLRLTRQAEALVGLDEMKGLSPDLLVLRAELRCEAKRFDEANADFGAVLVSGDERFAGRALFGRAMCSEARGDRVHMSEDLQRYLLLHPRGELADKARTELQRIPTR